MEPRSIQEGIEKAKEKWKAPRWPEDQNKTFERVAIRGVQGPGEGVGGGVNPSPREEGKGMRPVQRAKPPQPRGLVGFKEPAFILGAGISFRSQHSCMEPSLS